MCTRGKKSEPKKLSAQDPTIFEDNDIGFGHLSGFAPLPGTIENVDSTKVVCFYGCGQNEINAFGDTDVDKIHAVMEGGKPAPTNSIVLDNPIVAQQKFERTPSVYALTEALAKTADAVIAATETVIIAAAAAAATAETAAVLVVEEDIAAGVTVSDIEKEQEQLPLPLVNDAGDAKDVAAVNSVAAVSVEEKAEELLLAPVNDAGDKAADPAAVAIDAAEGKPEELLLEPVNDAGDEEVDPAAIAIDAAEGKPEELLLAPVNDAGDEAADAEAAAVVAIDAAEGNVLAVVADEEQVNEANVIVAVIPPPPVYVIKCKRITRRRRPVNDGEPLIPMFAFIRPKRIQERRKIVEDIDPPFPIPAAKFAPLFRHSAQAFYRPPTFVPLSVPAVNGPKSIEQKKQQLAGKLSTVGQSTTPKAAVAAVSSGEVVKRKRKRTGKKQPSVQKKLPEVNNVVAKAEVSPPLSSALVKKRKLVAKCTTIVDQEIPGVEPVAVTITASTSLPAVDVVKKRKCLPEKLSSVQQEIPVVQQVAVAVVAAAAAITLSTVDTVKKRNHIAKKRPSVQPEIPDVIQVAVASVSAGEVVKKRKRFAKNQDVDQTAAPSLACVEVVKTRNRLAKERPSVQQEIAYVVKVKKSKRFKRKWSRVQAPVDQGNGKKRPRRLKEIPTVELNQCKRIEAAAGPRVNNKIRQPVTPTPPPPPAPKQPPQSKKKQYLTTYRKSIIVYTNVDQPHPVKRKRKAKPRDVKYNFGAQTNQIFTSNNLRTTAHETINHNGRVLKAKPYAQIPMDDDMNENELPSLELIIFPEPENDMFSYLNIQSKDPKLQCEQEMIKLHRKIKEMLNNYLQYPEQYINLLTLYKNLPFTPLILKKNPHCLEMIYRLRNYCGNIKNWRYNNFENQPDNHMEFRAQIYCTLSLTNEIYQLFKSLFNYPKNLRFWIAFQADVEQFRKNIRNLSAYELKYLVEEPPNIDNDLQTFMADYKMDDVEKSGLLNDGM